MSEESKEIKEIKDPLTYKIIGCILNVYKKLGPGLLESVYEEALVYEMKKAGLNVQSQLEVPIIYDNNKLKTDLRLDVLVNDKVILELKSVEELKKVHFKQLQTYLKLTNRKVGLLVNFNVDDMALGYHRVVM